jgi:Tannase and feruloyl esterase
MKRLISSFPIMLVAAVMGLALPSSAWAQLTAPGTPVTYSPLPERAAVLPVIACDALAHRAFDRDKEAPARVLSAETVAATSDRAEFCLVKGYVAPNIQFELHLPTHGYSDRYLQGGCGGNCGFIASFLAPGCDTRPAFGGSFAIGFEDSGHVGRDGVWALGGEQVRSDFAYRAAHVFSVAAKRIIAAYYGHAPTYSYFQGCSDGGREAMAETQRYPSDFNGVVAGSPAFLITEAMERFIWEARWGRDAQGHPVFDHASLQLLHAAVIKACDRIDGLEDGQIDDPRRCQFDPGKLLCRSPQTTLCLTPQQVEVARKFYDGPRTPDGTALYLGGEPYGAELTWEGRIAFAEAGAGMLEDAVRDMIFVGDLPPDVTVNTWSFDLPTFYELARRGALYDANDPDLNAFRSAGGKLILWQGAADPAAGAYGVPDYYQRLQNAMGGLAATQAFTRYFVVPGVYHCGAGYVPYEEDFLGPIVQWVESGVAPDSVISTAVLSGGKVRTRPVYAYPARAKYRGSGSIDDASSFQREEPASPPRDAFAWAGAR